jgi:GR25 family glycosyltransferase involved in LPS biosynthesis
MHKQHTTSQLVTHVLNLERSPERWAFVAGELDEHGLNPIKIVATDGNVLTDAEINAHYDKLENKREYFWPLKRSEIGCFLSHRKSMQRFIEDECAEYLLLVEDDVQVETIFSTHIDQWISLLRGKDPLCLKLFTKRSISGKTVATIAGVNVIRPSRVPLGCVAQLLNRSAARSLLEESERFSVPIDVLYQQWWKHKVDVLCTESSLFVEVSHQLGGTNIGGSEGLCTTQKIKRELGRSWFRLKLSIISRALRLLTKDKGDKPCI